MILKKQTSFIIEEEWITNGGSVQKAAINLSINYSSKSFDITPSFGGDKFGFIQTSHKHREWMAVAKCIQQAIEFARKELDIS